MLDLSCICDLHHISWQCQILNPLSEARDRIQVLTDTSWYHYHWVMMGIPWMFVHLNSFYFTHPPDLTPLASQVFGLFFPITEFDFILFLFSFSDSTCEWNHTVLVFLWIILYSILHCRSIRFVTVAKFLSVYGCIIFHCISYLLYSFIYQCTLRLLLYFGYC